MCNDFLAEDGFSGVGLVCETTLWFSKQGLYRRGSELLSILITSNATSLNMTPYYFTPAVFRSSETHIYCNAVVSAFGEVSSDWTIIHYSALKIDVKCSFHVSLRRWRVSCRTTVLEDPASCLRTLQQSGCSLTWELECASSSGGSVSPLTAPPSSRLFFCSYSVQQSRGSCVIQEDSCVNIFLCE